MKLWHFAYERHNIAQELHQTANAHILACTNAEHWEDRTCNESLADAFAQLVLRESLLFEEFLHKSFVVLSCSLYERLMKLHCLIHLLCRDINDSRHTTFWSPCVHLHQKHVDDSIEARTSANRILNLNTLRAVDSVHVSYDIIEIALIRIQLVDKEDNRLVKFFGITEVVLCTNLRTVLTVNKNNSLIGYVEGCDCATDEVIRTRTINNVKLFVVPLYMEHCGEHRVTILMFYREVVAHRVLCFHRTTALDNTTTINHRLGKGGLAATRTA